MLGKRKPKTGGGTRGFFYVPKITRDGGIFVTDAKGYIFAEFFKVLAEEKGRPLPALVLKHPDNAANEYVRNFGMIAVLTDPEGSHLCYSVNYRNRLPPAFIERIRQHFQLMPDDTVLWSDDVFKDPQEAPAREVIYGERPEKPPRPETRAQIRKKWAHPQALNPAEMDYLSGKSAKPPSGS